jgi:hypothetical protein
MFKTRSSGGNVHSAAGWKSDKATTGGRVGRKKAKAGGWLGVAAGMDSGLVTSKCRACGDRDKTSSHLPFYLAMAARGALLMCNVV